MGFPRNPFLIFTLTIFFLTPHSRPAPTFTTLVYKGCAKQPLSDPTNSLPTLFGALISQSSKSKFFKTTSAQTPPAVTGLFQCRGDLSSQDCYACVSRLPTLMTKLCGPAIAARVQLLGCYMLYEGAGFGQVSGMEMLYKTCGGGRAAAGDGFEGKRDAALAAVVSGVGGGGGFFATGIEGVYAVGQCEGDVGPSDCAACVKSAAGRAQGECGPSAGAQIYLDKCFVGYSYYPNGVPKRSSPGSYDDTPSPSGSHTGKTVAIIVGGAAGVGFLVIFLLFLRGLLKKKDDY